MAQRIKIVLDEKTRIMVITAAIALGTLILCYNIYKSHADKIEELRSSIYEESQRLIARRDLAKIDGIISEYRKYIHQDTNSSIFRDTISALARELEIDIISMQPPKAVRVKNYIKYSLKIRVKCSYNEFGKFLEKIERLSALTTVDDIVVSEGSVNRIKTAGKQAPSEEETRVVSALTISAYSIEG